MDQTIQQTLQKLVEELKQNPKLKDVDDYTITKYVKRAVNQILAHCNREDLPEPLEDIAMQIAEDMLQVDGYIVTAKEVSSISRGDTSISYKTAGTAFSNAIAFMKDYDCQLMHYKKIRLPKDVRSHD